MKKNNGFVFVETIVVIVILTLGLVMVYSSFSSVLSNDKRRATYNDVAYIYRTYYIEDFLTSLNIKEYINNHLKDKTPITVVDLTDTSLYKTDFNINNEISSNDTLIPREEAKKRFAETIIDELKVEKIYIADNNKLSEIKRCTTRSGQSSSNPECRSDSSAWEVLRGMDTNMIYYIRTLSGKKDGSYRLIVKYKSEETDSDKTVSKYFGCEKGYKEVNGRCQSKEDDSLFKNKGEICPDSYVNINGICERELTRYYYSNVDLIVK